MNDPGRLLAESRSVIAGVKVACLIYERECLLTIEVEDGKEFSETISRSQYQREPTCVSDAVNRLLSQAKLNARIP